MKRRCNPLSRILALCVALGTSLSCTKEPTQPKPEVQELDLRTSLADGSEREAFARPQASLHDALERIWAATNTKEARGLFLRVGPMIGAWGRVDDLVEALTAYRATERPVHCHFEMADNVGYMLMAQGCDHVSMSPAGTLDLVGPALVMFYAKSLLERVGLDAQILHMGRYKGAGDMFIRDDMPPEARESLGAIVDGLYASLADAVKTRTGGDDAAVQAMIDRGPFVSKAALEAGLVDSVSFDDEAAETIRELVSVENVRRVKMMGEGQDVSLGDLLNMLSGSSHERQATGERIALVYVTGNIVDGEQAMVQEARSGPFIKAMRRLAKDDAVKAVLMRINSPGGSALASDRMWQAARALGDKKPLIASVGDMAASGGYYIASSAKEIFAHSSSLVGSIGVVGGKISMGALADRVGVHPVILQRGKHAAWASFVRPLDPSERGAFEGLLRDTYDRFIDRVSTGRKMEREKVLASAEGRVMTGRDGKERGLVDTVGGLGMALARTRQLAQLPDSAPVEIWPPEKGLIDTLAETFGAGGEARLSNQALRRELVLLGLPSSQVAAWLELVQTAERTTLVAPYLFQIR